MILLEAPEEMALAKHLLHFGLVLEAVAEEYRPNFLCNYLYELAGQFTPFTRIARCSRPSRANAPAGWRSATLPPAC